MLWLDGRPHPPAHAAHTWAGFSTARWDGDALTVFTTHLKAGWLQRNGVAHSDRATMTERFIRHGNHLTVVSIVDDPDLPRGAVHPHDELGAEPRPGDPAHAVRRRGRGRGPSEGRRASPSARIAGALLEADGVLVALRIAAGCGARRRRHDVSRIPADDEPARRDRSARDDRRATAGAAIRSTGRAGRHASHRCTCRARST